MRNQKVLCFVMALAIALSPVASAKADVLDDVVFAVGGMVFVWAAGSDYSTVPALNDIFLMDTTLAGGLATDMDPGNELVPVITGTMTPISDPTTITGLGDSVSSPLSLIDPATDLDSDASGWLDASDIFTGFVLQNTTDVDYASAAMNRSFYVASNCAFDIFARATVSSNTFTGLTLADIGYAMTITVDPADLGGLTIGGATQSPGTVNGAITDLSLMSLAFTKVMDGTQRTAAAVATIAAQSVEIQNTYTMSNYDLSYGTGVLHAQVVYTIYNP